MEEETSALLAIPRETRTAQVHAHTLLWTWFDGEWTVERAAGFRHLKLNAVAQVLGRDSFAATRILLKSVVSISAVAAKL